jgi:carboxymethylenebutenolidase
MRDPKTSDTGASGESPEAGLLSRREFAALSIAAGVGAAASGAAAAAPLTVSDKDVSVKTASGTCDAALVQPEGKGQWPAVILWPDAFGLRPTMREMARRLAAEGYVVLVPNPYYRSAKAPGIPSNFDFQNAADRARLTELRKPLTNEGVTQDAKDFLAFLDARPAVNRRKPAGVFGYCMGGTMTLQSAGGYPERIGAGASFHGGGLVTDTPDSPHLLVPRMKGGYYIGIAANDDERQPDAKTKLRAAFDAAHVPAKIEVYEGALHGWCVKDMPLQAGKPIYDEAKAERAWKELVALFKQRLA